MSLATACPTSLPPLSNSLEIVSTAITVLLHEPDSISSSRSRSVSPHLQELRLQAQAITPLPLNHYKSLRKREHPDQHRRNVTENERNDNVRRAHAEKLLQTYFSLVFFLPHIL